MLLLALRPSGLFARGGVGSSDDVPRVADGGFGVSRLPLSAPVLGGLLLAALLFPLADHLAGWQRLYSGVTALLLVSLAVGLNVVVGLAGLLDLGYAAFFAIGGYTAGVMSASGSRLALGLPEAGREPWLALVLAGLAGAIFAGLHGHIEPEQFDVTLSLMVLAAVVIGGRWSLGGVVLGALVVAAYDRVLVDVLTGSIRGLVAAAGLDGLRRADLRDDNFAVFGVALYLATVLRGRGK